MAFASVISQSAPHLYLSALPFASESCKLSEIPLRISKTTLGENPETHDMASLRKRHPASICQSLSYCTLNLRVPEVELPGGKEGGALGVGAGIRELEGWRATLKGKREAS